MPTREVRRLRPVTIALEQRGESLTGRPCLTIAMEGPDECHRLGSFDQTLQKTNIWLKEIMGHVGPDRQRAYHALRAVLHTVRDRLTVEAAAHLSAQLPLLIRGIYFEGWHPAHKPTKERSKEEFLDQIAARLQGVEPINPETAARAVLEVLERNIDRAEAAQVRHMLPKALQEVWPGQRASMS